jgi:hypothetical protein
MNPVSGTILAALVCLISFGPRRWAVVGILGGVFCLTQGHSLDIAGLNIYPIRILEAVAFCRVLMRGELVWRRLNRTDLLLLILYNYVAAVWILRSSGVSPQQFASALDPTLCYLSCRALINDMGDLRWMLRALAVVLVPFTALVCLERLTGSSAFTLVGAPAALHVRNGAPRCEGTFRHPILMGSVAASFAPLYIGLFFGQARSTVAAALGLTACVTLVALSGSGGPLSSTALAIGCWTMWPLRRKMKLVRRGIVAALIFLLFYMTSPIWYLPFKISAVVGGGGYHRGHLMDMAWQDLEKWWINGIDIKETARWFPYQVDFAPDIAGADITNQFLVFGLKAGLPGIALAIAVLVLAFKGLGRALATLRLSGARTRTGEFLLWGLGAALAVHISNWLGVSYFDQSWVIWLIQLAAAVSTSAAGPTGTRGAGALRTPEAVLRATA